MEIRMLTMKPAKTVIPIHSGGDDTGGGGVSLDDDEVGVGDILGVCISLCN
jgi:hypothetical protein